MSHTAQNYIHVFNYIVWAFRYFDIATSTVPFDFKDTFSMFEKFYDH